MEDKDYIPPRVGYLVRKCHDQAKNAGWWQDLKTGEDLTNNPYFIASKLMLIVSEISEAMEAHRKNLNDDKLPHRLGIEVELADAVIRIADLAGALKLDLGGAIFEKLEYNINRLDHKLTNRKEHHGKSY